MPVANCPGLPADDWPPNRIHFRTGHLAGHLAGHQFQKVPYYHEETAKVSPLSGVLGTNVGTLTEAQTPEKH